MTKAAESVTRYARFFQHAGVEKVLDYGAGTLRNSAYLMGEGFTVFAADLPEQLEQMRARPTARGLAGLFDVAELPQSYLYVDLVLSTYVFNIITSGGDQRRYLDNIVANLRPGGYLLMEVRCRRHGTECSDRCSDYFKCEHCVKTYTHEELDHLLTPYGFRRVSHYYGGHALSAVYTRT